VTDDELYLQHILEAIERIETYTEGIERDAFRKDSMAQDAVIRQLEVLGEAASQLSDETRDQYGMVPWQDITGMRNKLIHGYFGVDVDVVWKTVQEDLPQLKRELEDNSE
jgi:uncharacterized protein with HEPN domain